MDYKQIKEAVSRLNELENNLAYEYEDNGGEVTASTEAKEEEIAILGQLIEGEGIDDLGRWLRSLEDREASYKDEAAKLSRLRKQNKETIDFVRFEVGRILRTLGKDKVKGTLYSFKQTTSVTVCSNDKAIEEDWLDKVRSAAKEVGLPDYVGIKLSGSVTAAKALDELPEYFVSECKETSAFTKPRKTAE